ncbi:MAG: hypothetical protein E6G97_17760 [Alphaproteobacteria bacterium]|nr:MAG: hypothetical protein E6G97_17760 [Alphaproteobacteria bacterium]
MVNMKKWVVELLDSNQDVGECFVRVPDRAGPLVIEVVVDDDVENADGRVIAVYETGLYAGSPSEARLAVASPLAEAICLQGVICEVR